MSRDGIVVFGMVQQRCVVIIVAVASCYWRCNSGAVNCVVNEKERLFDDDVLQK
jgi:hypothetical protein